MWEDYKTAEDRLNRANTNDWYIFPLVILAALAVAILIIGADRFIDVMSDFIVAIRAS